MGELKKILRFVEIIAFFSLKGFFKKEKKNFETLGKKEIKQNKKTEKDLKSG